MHEKFVFDWIVDHHSKGVLGPQGPKMWYIFSLILFLNC